MRVVNTVHVMYVGLCSVLILLSSLLRSLGLLPASANAGMLQIVHYALAIVGILVVATYILRSQFSFWLLLVWWMPQLVEIVIATSTPTYPVNAITPIYLVSMGPHISIHLAYELGPDKFRLVRFNVVAIVGLALTFLSMFRKERMTTPINESGIESPAQEVKRSRLAVSSLILGILAIPLFGLTSVPCFICGHMARRRIRRASLRGSGLAIAGLTTGYLGILLFGITTYISSMRSVYRPYTLPSGKVVKLIGIRKWIEAGGENSLVLLYQSDVSLDSTDELREEVEHIWQYFQVNVEKQGMKKARILAHGPTKGRFVRKSRIYGFEIVKQLDGSWHFSELEDN